MKGFLIVALGFLFDAIPFFIGMGLMALFSMPGTFTGALAGCAVAGSFAGEAGCKIGGAILGLLGTLVNGEIATVTVPLGLLLTIVVTDAINILLGVVFIMVLWFTKTLYLPYLFMGSVKIVPLFNFFPWWATVAFLSVRRSTGGERGANKVIVRSRKSKSQSPINFSPTKWNWRPTEPRLAPQAAPTSRNYRPERAPTQDQMVNAGFAYRPERAPTENDLRRAGIPFRENPQKPSSAPRISVLGEAGPRQETSLMGINNLGGYTNPPRAANNNAGESPNTMSVFRPVAANENRSWQEVRKGGGEKFVPTESRVVAENSAENFLSSEAPGRAANEGRKSQTMDLYTPPKASNENGSWDATQRKQQKSKIDEMNSAI
jgi:hypothetical protein